MIKEVLIIVVLISSIPLGYLLAWLTKEELVNGRKAFLSISIISLILAIIFYFHNLTISLTLVFILISTLVSFIKSYDKDFIKERY